MDVAQQPQRHKNIGLVTLRPDTALVSGAAAVVALVVAAVVAGLGRGGDRHLDDDRCRAIVAAQLIVVGDPLDAVSDGHLAFGLI